MTRSVCLIRTAFLVGLTAIAGCGGQSGSGGAGGASGKGGSPGAGGGPGSGGRGGSDTGGTVGTGGGTAPATGGNKGGGGACGEHPGHGPLPATSTFYQDISCAAVDSESATIMPALQASGWGNGLGIDVSFTVLTADANLARRTFDNGGDDPDCDTAPVPLPPGGRIEGNSDYSCADGGDCHLLVYQGKRLYELYQADVSTGSATGGTFSGACLVVWDLTHDYWQPAAPPNFGRGDHCNGADAADMPIAPLLLTAADIASGEVAHALRFTVPNPHIRASVYVHPATHIGGPSGGADQLPYGARLRLRSGFDLSTLPNEQARIVARALQRYGMFLTDGGNLFISATADAASAISTSSLRAIKATDFEMVEGGQRLNWRSYQCNRTVVTD